MRRPTAVAANVWLIITAIMMSGCADASRTQPKTAESTAQPNNSQSAALESKSTPKDSGAGSAAASVDIKLDLVSFDELQQRIASYKDRVVVVDAWSTSCLPCMKEFPHLVELARQWPEDVVCISVNLDFAGLPNTTPKDGLPGVTKFLQSKAADAPNLVHLLSTETDEQMFGKFEIESIPSIFVYDRSGALASKLTIDTAGPDGLTYAGDVVPLVEKLIEK